MLLFYFRPMEITSNSLKTSSFHILFILFMFLFSIPLLQCDLERAQEGNVSISNDSLSVGDCLSERQAITNDTNTILVSNGKVFEFGLFTPDKKAKDSRYLGIWYYEQSKAKIVVWVANRDKPLLGSSGSLVIEHGKAKLLDGKGVVYWSTDGSPSGQVQTMGSANSAPTFNNSNTTSPNVLLHYATSLKYNFRTTPSHNKTSNITRKSIRLCLKDTGNLILDDRAQPGDPVLWQSFDNPTDTFLPDMSVIQTSSLNLTCWQNHNNPAKGNFTFLLQPGTSNEWVIKMGQSIYWQSRAKPFDKLASTLSQSGIPLLQANTRLVMNFTGQFQLWKWENKGGWYLNWSEPKDNCSLEHTCGGFSICNSYNRVLCKCLPGFMASAKSGDASRGCSPVSGSPNERNDFLSDTFFPLPMMAVGNGTCYLSNDENCSYVCLNDYQCVAYSQGFDCSGASSSTENSCSMWKNELTNLQESSPDGITIFVRTTQSDIEPFPKQCRPCGAYIVPYPLSTGRNCGDPSYFNFYCNNKTGQVSFSTPKGKFRVSSISPDTKSFSIQVMHSNCDSRYIDLYVLSDKDSFPYTFRNCNVVEDRPFNQQLFIEIELVWKPPLHPLCNASSDCNQWSHTTCKLTYEGKRRCLCGSKFRWNGMKLKCTRAPFPLKVVIPCIAGVLAVFLVCLVFLVYHMRKRRMTERQGLFEFEGDDIDTEGTDVPFFDWENILAATSNFADANSLGIGGFGSVYLGKLPDGEEIAVKRLSNVSVQGVQEFSTEVMLIAKLQHQNLVKLLGYCTKADEKILVYEFMPNGSLDSSLFDEKHSVYLDWKKRFDIILGIARGLLYLHQDSRLRIIHRDLKPSNILLDKELNPKISDFGIARIVGGKDTEASTCRVVGTYGYMSPEYAYEGIFSVKSDVFSFGVVMLETISGRRNSRIFMFEHGLSLLGYAWKLWNEDKGLELMDPKLNESRLPSEVQKCIHIGLLCVQEDPSDRPTMATVVYMLSGENASLPLAKQPAFMNRKPLSDNASSSSAKDLSAQEVMTVSTVDR